MVLLLFCSPLLSPMIIVMIPIEAHTKALVFVEWSEVAAV